MCKRFDSISIANSLNCGVPSWPFHPGPNLGPDSTPTVYPSTCVSGAFHPLPTEIMQHILQNVPLQSILALSSASRSLQNLPPDPPYLKQVLKQAIIGGSLRWILPVETLPGEVQSALNAFSTWSDKSSPVVLEGIASCKLESILQLLALPSFPHFQFTRACFDSDSMMNRKRLWGIVKQYDGLWRDYRLRGYEVRRFQR